MFVSLKPCAKCVLRENVHVYSIMDVRLMTLVFDVLKALPVAHGWEAHHPSLSPHIMIQVILPCELIVGKVIVIIVLLCNSMIKT